jgi:hypothetical protein
MSELSCGTLFIGRNETHDLSRYLFSLSPFLCLWSTLLHKIIWLDLFSALISVLAGSCAL